jgi:hypothetical protein
VNRLECYLVQEWVQEWVQESGAKLGCQEALWVLESA